MSDHSASPCSSTTSRRWRNTGIAFGAAGFAVAGFMLGALVVQPQGNKAPESLALVDDQCGALLETAGVLASSTTTDQRRVASLSEMQPLLPEGLRHNVSVLIEAYEGVEDGDLQLLTDEAKMESARLAGEAIVQYLDVTCGIDLTAPNESPGDNHAGDDD